MPAFVFHGFEAIAGIGADRPTPLRDRAGSTTSTMQCEIILLFQLLIMAMMHFGSSFSLDGKPSEEL